MEVNSVLAGIQHSYLTSNKKVETKAVENAELSEAEKLEAFKKEIWNEINRMPRSSSINWSIQITEGVFKRMMEDSKYKAEYTLSGKCSVTLEEDLAGFDRAYQRQLAYMAGYITCQQTNDGAKFFGSADIRVDDTERKEYTDTAVDMMEQAQKKLLEMHKQSDYKERIGRSIILDIMNSDTVFTQKTRELFTKTIKYNVI